jgi:biopolymer transport protein ExbB
MSSGVARATIPTMAGMVSALSGLLFSNQIERMASQRVHELADELEVE